LGRHLTIFTRYPKPGRTKTRLIPALGAEEAALLQTAMTGRTVLTARHAARSQGFRAEIRFTGGSRRQMRRWLGPGLAYTTQGSGDLGLRMSRAFRDHLHERHDAAVIIGSDCPGLTPSIIRQAFDALLDTDLVIGPAADGGYYLIGLKAPAPAVFENIDWGSDQVLSQTLNAAERAGMSYLQLAMLNDVDRPEDLEVWHEARRNPASAGTDISVIIPTLNEDRHIGACIERAAGYAREIIVVDGGSRDRTQDIASQQGATVLCAPRGRACQMNAGALCSSGSILVFLHADALLPVEYASMVRTALERPGTVAGAFRLRISRRQPGLRLVETAANWRSRLLQRPYGDQALFTTREAFFALGGFADIPIMEDLDLVRRLAHRGRVCLAPASVTVSDRRWSALGTWKTTAVNQLVLAGYGLGVPPSLLARLYGRRKDPAKS